MADTRTRDRGLCRVVLVLILMVMASGLCRASGARDYRAFLTALEAAVNKGDVPALKQMSLPGVRNDFTWTTKPPGMFGRALPWQAKVLELPGQEGQTNGTFVAFSRYQVVESAGDHLYRVAVTTDGPRLREEMPETETGGYRVRDHKLTVRFDIPRHHVRITDRVTVEREGKAEGDSRTPAPILRLNAIYAVTSVARDGNAVPYRQAGGFLVVPFSTGDRATYDLAYEATISGLNEDFIKPTEAALTAYWYPHIARLPATHEVRITVPRGWTAIGQGELTGKSFHGGETTFAWKNTLPVCYFTVAAGRYSVTTRKIGNVNVSAFLLHNSTGRARQAIDTAGGAIQWFSKNFHAFPYTRYAVVESDTFPPALESYSFTLINRGLIPIAITHEVSHTWWGGLLPNTYTRSLWNEAMAEYSDGLYQRQTGRTGMHDYNTQMMAMGMGALMSRVSLTEAKDAMDIAESAVGYGKGSLVLENLERMLGTPRMLETLRQFIARHTSGEAVEWQQYMDTVTQIAGKEWAAFFPPWLTRTDLPDLRLKDVRTTQEGGKYFVSGTVAQGSPVFWLQVPVVVHAEEGEARQDVTLKTAEAPFRIELASKPTEVVLDPHRETLRSGGRPGQPPSLMTLQTASGPLLVVCATGGTPAESAAVRAVAESRTKELFPFADVTVKADTEVTPDMLAAANVLLLGRPESLRLPDSWRDALPLRYTAEGISYAGKEWKGGDLWGLVVLAHPTRPNGLLAHASGVSPDAIRSFDRQGDLDGSKSLFIVRGAGKTLTAGQLRPADPTVVTLSP